MSTLESITGALEKARVTPKTITFEGKSLKLDTEENAKVIVDAIAGCKDLECLNLEGNTLGVEAAKAIATALERQSKLHRALWKDMFTGRMKSEIPKALEYLGAGLVKAGARLTELDLSDNAFGPIGVQGLAALLRSSSCYALQELRLNNNGLGITGGKLLADALTECYTCSNKLGKPMALKVFVAGRNRLENDGAKALAQVFKTIGTLEEVAMPQNGIYHKGIEALADAFVHNKNLQILNLNDNTIGPKGAKLIANALPHLQRLKSINFGDCLLKTKGTIALAASLRSGHENLEELILGFNEINIAGGTEIAKAMAGKPKLRNLVLDGNHFDRNGKTEITDALKRIGKLNALDSLDECDSEKEDDSEDEESEPEEVEEIVQESVSYENFVNVPNAANFYNLGNDRNNIILGEVKKDHSTMIPILMHVSALGADKQEKVAQCAVGCSEQLYRELYTWAEKNDTVSLVNNNLLVHLGLIKCEDKKFKPKWNTEACLSTLKAVLTKQCIPQSATATLKFFVDK
ncbi:hypothetical protein PPYR_10009 [Photinus pyralis]|uniref:Ran-GTPase activating protein 1 C-terminal domain-containing protein n=1 Tax=Photinus pyralis TaxID=7054 RepID=A0A1Y1N9Y0_PHOPY|nr:ran GTPase-activating protein 1-like [Photinus pyralis]KAB0795948.1 hypothetical protein PPYR_10009 [Photinus pyralis]